MLKFLLVSALILLNSGFPVDAAAAGASVISSNWKSDWAVAEGFSIRIDTEGYTLPSAIAFVPNPGKGPKDPFYFITELKGKIKVITNDRTVFTFAEDFFRLRTPKEPPSLEGQSGLAGICLDPDRGYIFATFAYQDQGAVLRNDIVRFQSTPLTFSLKATGLARIAPVFASEVSSASHQVGPCQVKDGLLYVSVGDGARPAQSRQLASTLGKILRMTADGKPVKSNPFYQDDNERKARNYVWAYGFRNPFSMKFIGDRLFAGDNGTFVDRFVEVRKGNDYLWNGTTWSVGTNAFAVVARAIGPVQLDYYTGQPAVLPKEFVRSLFVAASGTDPDFLQVRLRTGVVFFGFDVDATKVTSAPDYLLRYRGNTFQMLVGLALGPDALYAVPLLPDSDGRSAVLKIVYDPKQAHPFTLEQEADPITLIERNGCLGCHTLYGVGGARAPALDREALVDRLQTRLDSKAYVELIRQLDRLTAEPYSTNREARRQVLAATGVQRVRVWVRNQIRTPGFDNPGSQMPNLGVSERETSILVNYLVGTAERDDVYARIRRRLLGRYRTYLYASVGFMGGFVAGLVLLTLVRTRR